MQESPSRHFDLAGASNFRDLGGYPGKDGRRVRWRQLFRSNHLGDLTRSDADVLRDLGLKSAFDLRGIEERATATCALGEIAVHSLPIEPTVVGELRVLLEAGSSLSRTEAADAMRNSYRSYVHQNTARFRALLTYLRGDHAPLVVHCTAGKDRTGFACALILHALGVSDDLVEQDYLLTNRFYRRDPSAMSDLPESVTRVLVSVETSFLGAAFDAVNADYGDLEGYFREGLGVGPSERAALQAQYLEP